MGRILGVPRNGKGRALLPLEVLEPSTLLNWRCLFVHVRISMVMHARERRWRAVVVRNM